MSAGVLRPYKIWRKALKPVVVELISMACIAINLFICEYKLFIQNAALIYKSSRRQPGVENEVFLGVHGKHELYYQVFPPNPVVVAVYKICE
ncbi:hypothetical protein QE152_g20724 [Popillia japonica]|uniref:Uncharacterized protein n=1 Tax=Popillia japonica TaxID=7064 RepID=A0AAW1KM06_POPJA